MRARERVEQSRQSKRSDVVCCLYLYGSCFPPINFAILGNVHRMAGPANRMCGQVSVPQWVCTRSFYTNARGRTMPLNSELCRAGVVCRMYICCHSMVASQTDRATLVFCQVGCPRLSSYPIESRGPCSSKLARNICLSTAALAQLSVRS